ncbi:MAG: efflux RND transporter permease subunit [Pseudomonadota bacterium]
MEKWIRKALGGGIPVGVLVLSLAFGLLALYLTPREEEPQIVVPMVDVLIEAPGLSARQVERQVTTPAEKLLAQIKGVEHVYSTTRAGASAITLRYYVGESREDAILNTYNKLYSNQHAVPDVVTQWRVNPVEVDDIPIVVLGLYSRDPERYSEYQLRRIADEMSIYLQGIENSNQVQVVGGPQRTVQVLFDPQSLSARQSTVSDILSAIQRSNQLSQAGYLSFNNRALVMESGDYLRTVKELESLPVNVIDGEPVLLGDVATIEDGPEPAKHYSWLQFKGESQEQLPMVAVSIAKKRGSNAVSVANDVHQLSRKLREEVLPEGVGIEVLRDYGATANEKVNNLSASLLFAIFTVVVFISLFLGWRHALVVGLAVPVSYGITLALDMAFGYTINRVTLFALILSLGLLVDDPITGVDNIERLLRQRSNKVTDPIVEAISEIKRPLIMSTVTIILAFVPLAFITGMMGPYMAPMAFNVPVSVISSTLVAFFVTPWLASKALNRQVARERKEDEDKAGFFMGLYQKVLGFFIKDRRHALLLVGIMVALFAITAALPLFRLVPLKLLPYDNKNEFQVVIDMPESASLEATAAMAQKATGEVLKLNEVDSVAAFVGAPSPIDFNGMVRRYYQREAPWFADLRVQLIDKTQRSHQSHQIVLRLREQLQPLIDDGVQLKVVEVPPGPPVLSTLVAEVYGDHYSTPKDLQRAARTLAERLRQEPFVYDVDTGIEQGQQRLRFVTDKQKAALSGVATADINQLLRAANQGMTAAWMPEEREANPLPIRLRLPQEARTAPEDFLSLQLRGQAGVVRQRTDQGLDIAARPLVSLGELGQFETSDYDHSIQHKDLKPVVYVSAELSGRTPAEVIADVSADRDSDPREASHWSERTFFGNGSGLPWSVAEDIQVSWTGEGEWKITVDVFRDMGLAFLFALTAIFFVMRWQIGSSVLTLIIMSSIPLTVIGIMPGFWLLNLIGERTVAGAPDPVLFTATAMIGMIALAGIVVRNSLILIEFIEIACAEGKSVRESVMNAGLVRMRPVLLTAATTMLGNLVITLDPVFKGLALAIIFGIVASTLFTLLVVPTVYYLLYERKNKEPSA